MVMRIIAFPLAFALIGLTVAPAWASQAKVVWNDLDLTSAAGKTELDRRIDAAAREICTPEAATGSRLAKQPSHQCLAETRGMIEAKLAARIGDRQVQTAQAQSGASSEAR